MRDANRWAMCLLCLVALGCHAEAGGVDARTRLAANLRDSLGAKADSNGSLTVPTTAPATSPGRSPAVAEACDAYAKIFSASATAAGISTGEVGSRRDTVLNFGDLQGERAEPACLVAWNDDSTRVAPLEDVFTRATAAGWTERDHLLSADGPDGSVLAFSRGDVACVIRGSWDGGDDSDSTYVPSPGFVISASCFANRPDRY